MIKISSVNIKAKVAFNSKAIQFFKFPILNPVRISFWEEDARYSCPSEISSALPIVLDAINVVNIMIPEGYLKNGVNNGDTFYVGLFPLKIGQITVLELIE